MAKFDDLLSSLHTKSALTDKATDNTEMLIVDEKRKISIGTNFNPVIAYEGDINSQIVLIECIRIWDSHDLSACVFKELRWKNKVSGNEGISKLAVSTQTEEKVYLKWEVPSEACTQAGILEISITLYDKSGDYIVFAWNTATFEGLSVGKSIESVNFEFPPKDEILIIDKDTKTIVAPVGYNNTICNYGEVGVSEVYFLVNRYLGKNREIDVLNEDTIITIYITMGKRQGVIPEKDGDIIYITKRLYTAEIDDRNKEGLVLLTWAPPAGVTAGPTGPNTMQITIGFDSTETVDGKAKTKKWFSNIYTKLNVGNSMFAINTEEPDEEWSLLDDYVKDIIDKYITENEFIIG